MSDLLYDAARAGAGRIYDREGLALYWKEQAEYFRVQLEHAELLERVLAAGGMPEQEALHEAIERLAQIVDVCLSAYELHA